MNNQTEQQLLGDPDIQPSDDILSAALDGSYAAYVKFTDMLVGFGMQPEWRYYNDGKAWLLKGLYKWKSQRGTDKEKTVFWLSVWDGFFKLSFFVGENRREDLLNLPLSENIKRTVADAKKMGKLKFFPLIFDVRSDELLSDFGTLIEFQKSIK